MHSLADIPVGQVIETLPYQTEKDRVCFPFPGEVRNYLRDGIPLEYDPFTGGVRVKSNMTFRTFERCPDGWKRIV